MIDETTKGLRTCLLIQLRMTIVTGPPNRGRNHGQPEAISAYFAATDSLDILLNTAIRLVD